MNQSNDQDGGEVAPRSPVLGYFVPAPALPAEGLLSVGEVWSWIWRKKFLITALAVVMALLAYFGSTFQQKAYRADTVLAIVKTDQASSSISGIFGQLGGLAALAGLRGGGGSRDEQLAFLNSKGLKRQFIVQFDLLPVLFSERWDASSARWTGKQSPVAPSIEMGVRKFDEAVLQIDQDKTTGLVRLRCEWRDREVAARWANDYVGLANKLLREKAVREANSSISYLNAELRKTTSVDLQQAIFRLIQEQMNSAMLANVRQDYAFSVIDPAIAPDADRYVKPRPVLYAALAAFTGLLLGALFAMRGVRKVRAK